MANSGFTFKLMANGDWRYHPVHPFTLLYYGGARILEKKREGDEERGTTGVSEEVSFFIFNQSTKECYHMFRDNTNCTLHKVMNWDGQTDKEVHVIIDPETTSEILIGHGDLAFRHAAHDVWDGQRKFECFLGLFDY